MSEEKENRANLSKDEVASKDEDSKDEIIEGEIIEEGQVEESSQYDAYNQLAQELQEAEQKSQEYFEGWQRERADFANYKRRIERDQQAIAENIKGEIVKKYLTVLDDMERAIKDRPVNGPAGAWANGVELIQRKLQNILESEGVHRIPAEAEEFNPARHEAISYEESPNHEGGQIIEVIQQGYTLGDRVIRPALVRVARG